MPDPFTGSLYLPWSEVKRLSSGLDWSQDGVAQIIAAQIAYNGVRWLWQNNPQQLIDQLKYQLDTGMGI
jgi:hypothetical protein